MIKEILGQERLYMPNSEKRFIRIGDEIVCRHAYLPVYLVSMDMQNVPCRVCGRVWKVGDEHPEWL